MRWPSHLKLYLFALLFTGCGAEGFVPVSGKVTLDNVPLAGARVSFEPQVTQGTTRPEGSFGVTDGEGNFSLRRVSDDARGAATGEHIVTLSKNEATNPADDAAPVVEHVPEKFRKNPFTVPAGGTDQANFAITTK